MGVLRFGFGKENGDNTCYVIQSQKCVLFYCGMGYNKQYDLFQL